jgi:hypothetical protein
MSVDFNRRHSPSTKDVIIEKGERDRKMYAILTLSVSLESAAYAV